MQCWIQFTDFEALACVYTVEAWHGNLAPDDPEEEILSVAWVPLPQAIAPSEGHRLFAYVGTAHPLLERHRHSRFNLSLSCQ